MTTTITEIVAWVAETLDRLAPVVGTTTGTTFHAGAPQGPDDEDPKGELFGDFDRSYEIQVGTPIAGDRFGCGERSLDVPVSIVVHYQISLDLEGLQARAMADREQIEAALLVRDGAPEGVVLVTTASGVALFAPGPHPDKARQSIAVTVRYRHSLP